jgi:hypothetical protein
MFLWPARRRAASIQAAPTVGWPANGISLVGVKMLRPAVNVVEDHLWR